MENEQTSLYRFSVDTEKFKNSPQIGASNALAMAMQGDKVKGNEEFMEGVVMDAVLMYLQNNPFEKELFKAVLSKI